MNKQLNLIKEYVIGTVADDYESFEMLTHEIIHWPDDYKEAFSRDSLIEALTQAIVENAVIPYLYDTKLNRMEKANLDVTRIDDYWFLISDNAKAKLKKPPE